MTAALADPDWTRASTTPTRLVVTVENTSKEEVTLTYEAGPCPCGLPDGTGAVQALGLPAADPKAPACEAAHTAILQACADMGACFDDSDPSIRLAPGARMDFPVSFPIDAAGVPCAYGALPRKGPLKIEPRLSARVSTASAAPARMCAQPAPITLR